MSRQEDLGGDAIVHASLAVLSILSFLGGCLLLGIAFAGTLSSGYWISALRDVGWGLEIAAITLVSTFLWGILSVIVSLASAVVTSWFRQYFLLSFFRKVVAFLPVLNLGFVLFLWFGAFLMTFLVLLAILVMLPFVLVLFLIKW
ncbi:MAG: hypothetical protein U9M98_02430 [Patescibacteria group bacterium]|nr:hypothetical protein [Patescibacteria group bacterium]